ncbi:hypothetical protein ES702_03907 [subsurface metagenome]
MLNLGILEKSIIIKGNNINDLSDLLRIARSIGKTILHVDKVNVNPLIFYDVDEYIVRVSKGC